MVFPIVEARSFFLQLDSLYFIMILESIMKEVVHIFSWETLYYLMAKDMIS